MRLWHKDLIQLIPKSQLQAQWRELNSIYKKQDKHILINYIYQTDKRPLLAYSRLIINEMVRRKCNIKSFEKFETYFAYVKCRGDETYFEHNLEYLTICYWNLREKYIRGQKDFYEDTWNKIDEFYKKELEKNEKERMST